MLESICSIVNIGLNWIGLDWIPPILSTLDEVRPGVHGGPGGGGGASSQSIAGKYFAQISRENITRLYEKYQVDFEMFGYEGQVENYVDLAF